MFFNEEPEVIFDVGAYDAKDTVKFKQYCPNARVVAIEASPKNFAIAKEVCDKYNIECYNYAVCDKVGTVEFHENDSSMPSCSMMEVDYKKADLPGPFTKT
ncbi:MAG: FkbM family methyltransferase, partial [Nanoarchaeota archaeon]|nr:FkbM family methyltransferase [Nanoarchaeota archaeon]